MFRTLKRFSLMALGKLTSPVTKVATIKFTSKPILVDPMRSPYHVLTAPRFKIFPNRLTIRDNFKVNICKIRTVHMVGSISTESRSNFKCKTTVRSPLIFLVLPLVNMSFVSKPITVDQMDCLSHEQLQLLPLLQLLLPRQLPPLPQGLKSLR